MQQLPHLVSCMVRACSYHVLDTSLVLSQSLVRSKGVSPMFDSCRSVGVSVSCVSLFLIVKSLESAFLACSVLSAVVALHLRRRPHKDPRATVAPMLAMREVGASSPYLCKYCHLANKDKKGQTYLHNFSVSPRHLDCGLDV